MAAGTNRENGYLDILKTLFLEICGVTGRGALTSLPLQVHPLILYIYRLNTVIRYETLNGKYQIRVNFYRNANLALKLNLQVILLGD